MEHLNRWLAGSLIVMCVAATWVGATRPQTTEATRMDQMDLGVPLGDRFQILTLQGAITTDRGGGSPFGGGSLDALTIRDRLIKAAEEDSIKGVLLRIDSPGGTVGASQEVYNAVLALRKKKPVVVSMGDTAASGGYYIACAADRILANPGTLTGSIGVIISGFNASKLLNTVGLEPQVIKSGKYKDILSFNRALTPEERVLLQALIQDTYEQFVGAVATGRNMTTAQIRPLADGRIYTGRQAEKLGLVDQLGGLTEAKATLKELAQKRFPDLKDKKVPFTEGGSSLSDAFGTLFQSKIEVRVPLGISVPENSLQPLWLAPGLGLIK